MHPIKLNLLVALAFALTLFANSSEWIWGSIYHFTHPAWQVVSILAAYALITLAFVASLTIFLGSKKSLQIVSFATLVLYIYTVYVVARQLNAAQVPWPMSAKYFSIVVVLLGISIFLYSAKIEYIVRVNTAISLSAIFYLISPLLVVAFTSQVVASPFKKINNTNTIYLLLDELSDTAIDPIIRALESENIKPIRSSLITAGSDTIFSIPAMITGKKFDQARPCSATAVCSGGNILDFSKISQVENKLSIVGVHHPYCAIKGLRYCYQSMLPTYESIIIDSVCFFTKLVYRGQLDFCSSRLMPPNLVNNVRNEMFSAYWAAPFWSEGGVMFAHFLLPHPPGLHIEGGLNEEYAANINDAALFVTANIVALDKKFDKNYTLVITTDHPLRRNVWCKFKRYSNDGCMSDPLYSSKNVPMIVASRASYYYHPPDNGINKFQLDVR